MKSELTDHRARPRPTVADATFHYADIETLVRPRRVAVVGASNRPGSMGNSTYVNVRKHSDIESVFPVNPGSPQVCGDASYPTVSSIPGPPMDVVIILVAAEHVLDAVTDCVAAGVRHVIVLSSGFSEVGVEGVAMQEAILRTARAAGMTLYGPNSPGLANIADKVLLSMSPVAHEDVVSGPVGLVTQGGGIGRAIMQWMDLGLGIGMWASPGNAVDLDIADFIHQMLLDDRITVIAAVVEGFSDGAKFIDVAKKARAAGKPIVLMKIGRSEYGQMSAASHTASIAGDDEVADAVFEQFGVIRVNDVNELAETAALLSRISDPSRVGDICVYSFSGGTSSHAADLVGAQGLRLAEFSPQTKAVLDAHAPSFGFVDNPVDLTTRVFTDSELNRRILGEIAADPAVGSILFAMPADYADSTISVVSEAIEIVSRSDTLLVPVWMSPRHGGGFRVMVEAGMVPFASVSAAVKALGRISRWAGGGKAATGRAPRPEHKPDTDSSPVRALDYGSSRALLEPAGIRFPREVFADSAQAAVDAVAAVDRPVAVKVVADGLLHKTEVGGVRLNVRSRAEAVDAYESMCGPAGIARLGVVPSGVTVQEMIEDGVDVLVGVHDDPIFGPVLTFGTGGIYTEIERDVMHLSIPFDRKSFDTAAGKLRVWKRLTGVRGEASVDLDAVFEAVRSVATAYVANPQVSELEINPLRALRVDRGGETVALDAVIVLARP
ncbi:acetate--CoA ligase family protein [Dactylosporangium fulvum]|uniref:Acetate--CoA ligase family protein n=1 Tax=Dactylosporangium fulvum TaxID=53359 RepID=A0ABY5VPR5_9ACTN|nr:acetate--CoA ligase family protein [Dactylosporangium fulvum]UWP79747.1 acetate--CoA ligase family protein [Dactylosporangium fulvum]